MHAERIHDPPTWIVRLEGEQDLATSRSIAATIARVVADGDPLVVDLSAVTFAESAVLGVLLRVRHDLPEHRFAVVAAPGSQPDRLFDLVDARSIVPVFRTRDAAVAWCHGGAAAPGGEDLRLGEPA